MSISNYTSNVISYLKKHLKFFFIYLICCLIFAFTILYHISENNFKSKIIENISEKYDIDTYPIYIVKSDSLELIPIPDSPQEFPDNAADYDYSYSNANIFVSSTNTITVTLYEIENSNEFLLYNADENKLYNIMNFSKKLYIRNYIVSFTPSYKTVTVTFTLNY